MNNKKLFLGILIILVSIIAGLFIWQNTNENITIITDKQDYKQDEDVKMTIRSNSDNQ